MPSKFSKPFPADWLNPPPKSCCANRDGKPVVGMRPKEGCFRCGSHYFNYLPSHPKVHQPVQPKVIVKVNTESSYRNIKQLDPDSKCCTCDKHISGDRRTYIYCKECEQWFHGTCVGLDCLDLTKLERDWECFKCKDDYVECVPCDCKQPYMKHDSFVCQMCSRWLHYRCTGILPVEVFKKPSVYSCPECDKQNKNLNVINSTNLIELGDQYESTIKKFDNDIQPRLMNCKRKLKTSLNVTTPARKTLSGSANNKKKKDIARKSKNETQPIQTLGQFIGDIILNLEDIDGGLRRSSVDNLEVTRFCNDFTRLKKLIYKRILILRETISRERARSRVLIHSKENKMQIVMEGIRVVVKDFDKDVVDVEVLPKIEKDN